MAPTARRNIGVSCQARPVFDAVTRDPRLAFVVANTAASASPRVPSGMMTIRAGRRLAPRQPSFAILASFSRKVSLATPLSTTLPRLEANVLHVTVDAMRAVLACHGAGPNHSFAAESSIDRDARVPAASREARPAAAPAVTPAKTPIAGPPRCDVDLPKTKPEPSDHRNRAMPAALRRPPPDTRFLSPHATARQSRSSSGRTPYETRIESDRRSAAASSRERRTSAPGSGAGRGSSRRAR